MFSFKLSPSHPNVESSICIKAESVWFPRKTSRFHHLPSDTGFSFKERDSLQAESFHSDGEMLASFAGPG